MADDFEGEPPVQNKLHDDMTSARLAGYSWPEINDFVGGRKAALGQFYNPDEVRQFLGTGNPAATNDRLQAMFQENLNRSQPMDKAK